VRAPFHTISLHGDVDIGIGLLQEKIPNEPANEIDPRKVLG
jgi:hypothetical protein